MPSKHLIETITALAEFERDIIRERTRAGLYRHLIAAPPISTTSTEYVMPS